MLFLLSNLIVSRYGRTWRAVRDDEIAAQLTGINLGRARVLAFVVSAACAGVGGVLFAVVSRLASPPSFSLVLSISLLVAIVIGGLGSLVGALLGSAMLVFFSIAVTDAGTLRGALRRAGRQPRAARVRRRADPRDAAGAAGSGRLPPLRRLSRKAPRQSAGSERRTGATRVTVRATCGDSRTWTERRSAKMHIDPSLDRGPGCRGGAW